MEDAIHRTVPQILAELTLTREMYIQPHGGRCWLAYVDPTGEWIASLSWNPSSPHPVYPVRGTVDAIDVDERYRRRGVATALWREVREIDAELHHADPGEWSLDGAAWIAAIGGPIAHHEPVDSSTRRVRRSERGARSPRSVDIA